MDIHKFIEKTENALALMLLDGKKDLAHLWGPIVEAMLDKHYTLAIILAERSEVVPPEFMEEMYFYLDRQWML